MNSVGVMMEEGRAGLENLQTLGYRVWEAKLRRARKGRQHEEEIMLSFPMHLKEIFRVPWACVLLVTERA